MRLLLAVDVGVRTGLAVYGDDGRLRTYRSQNFGSAARLRRAVPAILDAPRALSHVVLEGGGPLADIWRDASARRALEVMDVSAEQWRRLLLYDREQRTGADAKRVADGLARRVIDWSEAPRPTSLRHDAAEAILVGLYAAVRLGWLAGVPSAIR
jgi:hypothetical protein